MATMIVLATSALPPSPVRAVCPTAPAHQLPAGARSRCSRWPRPGSGPSCGSWPGYAAGDSFTPSPPWLPALPCRCSPALRHASSELQLLSLGGEVLRGEIGFLHRGEAWCTSRYFIQGKLSRLGLGIIQEIHPHIRVNYHHFGMISRLFIQHPLHLISHGAYVIGDISSLLCTGGKMDNLLKRFQEGNRSARSSSLIRQRGISLLSASPSGCSPSITARRKSSRSYSPPSSPACPSALMLLCFTAQS